MHKTLFNSFMDLFQLINYNISSLIHSSVSALLFLQNSHGGVGVSFLFFFKVNVSTFIQIWFFHLIKANCRLPSNHIWMLFEQNNNYKLFFYFQIIFFFSVIIWFNLKLKQHQHRKNLNIILQFNVLWVGDCSDVLLAFE